MDDDAEIRDDERPTLVSLRGKYAGAIKIHDDFDELPRDIAEALGAVDPLPPAQR